MSFRKTPLEKSETDTKKACLHHWQAVSALRAILPSLAAFLSLSGLLGVTAPTLAQAQTISTTPHLDSNGWTVFTPTPVTSGTCAAGTANGTCIFYVSDSDGNDCNNGLSSVANRTGCGAGPLKTIAAGYQKLSAINGQPTWLLLKKGDTFSDQVFTNDPTGCCFAPFGRSADQPMVLSSYDPANPTVPNPGTGSARPLIKTTPGWDGLEAIGRGGGNNLAIVGLEFYSYVNDPNNPAYTGPGGPEGLVLSQPTSWLLIEDCKFSFYGNGIDLSFSPVSANNVALRRNVVVDNYGQGIFTQGITTGFLIEENVVDRNGWSTGQGNVRLHNLYLDGQTANPSPVNLRGNIISNDSSGSEIRSGGNISNNLWLRNPWSIHVGMPTAGVVTSIDNNVFTEAVAVGPAFGYAVDTFFVQYNGDYYNLGTLNFSNNITTQTAAPIGHGIEIDLGFTASLSNNIFFKWVNPIVDLSGGTVTYSGYNVSDTNGANNLGAPEPFPQPGRTVGTYYDSIVGSSGHTSFDFIAAARGQSKANWNPALMAAAVNDYIRAGFGITTSNPPPPPTASPPPPTADTTSPSVPTALAATAVSAIQVNLSWSASTDNVGVAGYKIFRNGTQVGTATNTSYQDTGLSSGATYGYAVAAYDAAGNTSAQSASVSVTTPAPTTVSAPAVAINSPSNGSVVNGSANIAVAANSANGIASITITADGNPLATCASVSSCATTWQKKKITQGTHTIGAIATDAKGLPAKASVTIVTRQ
jgi:chitodextrinase